MLTRGWNAVRKIRLARPNLDCVGGQTLLAFASFRRRDDAGRATSKVENVDMRTMGHSFRAASKVGLASLIAAASVAACSGSDEGTGNVPPPFFNQGGSTGQVPGGAAGTTGVINPGGAGTGSSDVNPGTINQGAGGSSSLGAGGTGGAIVDAPPTATPPSFFESGAWHGSAWTGVDTLNLGSTRTPLDFSMQPPGQPFCFSGSVAPDPGTGPMQTGCCEAVALLGFNVNQAIEGDIPGTPAPVLTAVPANTGVAVNYTKQDGQPLRIQLDGPTGSWCADLLPVQGPAFIRYQADPANPAAPFFRSQCWLAPGTAGSVPYAKEPISAVIMTVPGEAVQPRLFDVCVGGFADGNSIADAPTSINLSAGLLTGTLSGEAARVKVLGTDGKSYIINNNAWGTNSGDGTQRIRYSGNSFEVLQQSAGAGVGNSPASFPSIYIGNNGATTGVNGATTTGEDNMPKQISAIQSIQTRFSHNASNGDYNATYDVWFAPNGTPPAGYGTAQAAFLMVWTYKPGGQVAIGQRTATAMVANRQWGLFVGPRGGGGPDNNLPVISYVNEGPAIPDFSFDLKAFIDDALGRSIGGFNNTLFLTDIFAGFEIWSGGAGLRVNEFSATVQ
jgi:glycosyl hydrolase family 12